MFPRDMVCLRNTSVDALHKGDTEDDDDDDDNNNNNNEDDSDIPIGDDNDNSRGSDLYINNCSDVINP